MKNNAFELYAWRKARIVAVLAFLLLNYAVSSAYAVDESELGKIINCILCRIASIIFIIIGALAALLIMLAGLKWLASGDDPKEREAAKKAIIAVFVGLIIVFIAGAVVSYITSEIEIVKEVLGESGPGKWMEGCDDIC